MSKYDYLYYTPYLHSSEYLSNLYRQTNSSIGLEAIQDYMKRHKVYNDDTYKGYYWLSKQIAHDLEEDEELLKWRDMFQNYDLYVNPFGEAKIKRREF